MLIFLDLDGVMVTRQSCIAGERRRSEGAQIDVACVGELERICQATGAEIVISSSWRKIHSPEKIGAWLRARGLVTGRVIGATPDLYWSRTATDDKLQIPRAAEISTWLWSHHRSSPPRFVVLDDDTDAGFGFAGNFVRCGLDDGGLTPARADVAIRILQNHPHPWSQE